MFIDTRNRSSSSEDDNSNAENIITIKTPTSYVIVDVAKNEVTQKPRSRRSSRDRYAATGDIGDDYMIGDGKIPDKVWEAVEVLRAQSKTIMSLDDVQLQETATIGSLRSQLGAGSYCLAQSQTISVAHSRLSSKDGSIRVGIVECERRGSVVFGESVLHAISSVVEGM